MAWNCMQTIPNSLAQQTQQKIALLCKNISTASVCGQQTGPSSSTHGNAKSCILVANNPCHIYNMIDSAGSNMPIQSPEEEHDLEVIIDNKLKFHSYCWNQAAKANKVLNLIKPSVTSHQP